MNNTDSQIIDSADKNIRNDISLFLKEFNKREWSVRISKKSVNFNDYVLNSYVHKEDYGSGFVVDNKPVPYFHPNRSFHDEIIWLNQNLYYNNNVSFKNKLINSAIVKFYGPSSTLDIITGNSDILYLKNTGKRYIDFTLFSEDDEYSYDIVSNIEKAFFHKEKIWGTTELRTSLQTASRNHTRNINTLLDKRGLIDPLTNKSIVNDIGSSRKMRPSDMIFWLSDISDELVEHYKTKPTMKESFNFLTSFPGIGDYYGYHFSSNLARMPGIGDKSLIDVEWGESFKKLEISHGNLSENSDYVVAGPGALSTLKLLWPNVSMNSDNAMKLINVIKRNQIEFFNISSNEEKIQFEQSCELNEFTTFGIEIMCCQYNVFSKLKNNKKLALKRAKAPISIEASKPKTSNLFV